MTGMACLLLSTCLTAQFNLLFLKSVPTVSLTDCHFSYFFFFLFLVILYFFQKCIFSGTLSAVENSIQEISGTLFPLKTVVGMFSPLSEYFTMATGRPLFRGLPVAKAYYLGLKCRGLQCNH